MKLGNDMARAFWRSLPPHKRPGTKAYHRARLAAIKQMFKPRPFPVESTGIYGVVRR